MNFYSSPFRLGSFSGCKYGLSGGRNIPDYGDRIIPDPMTMLTRFHTVKIDRR
jgi:hypothetical protein